MQTQAKFHHQFHFTKTFKCFIRSSKEPYRSLQYNVNNLVLSFCPLVTPISGGFRSSNAMFRTTCILVLLLCSVLRSVPPHISKFRIIEQCRGEFQSKLKQRRSLPSAGSQIELYVTCVNSNNAQFLNCYWIANCQTVNSKTLAIAVIVPYLTCTCERE